MLGGSSGCCFSQGRVDALYGAAVLLARYAATAAEVAVPTRGMSSGCTCHAQRSSYDYVPADSASATGLALDSNPLRKEREL